MSADCFLDTNIIVYAFERDIPEKRRIALALIEPDKPWQISWQVVQEFSSVALHKFKVPLDSGYLNEFTMEILWPHCTVVPNPQIHRNAIQLQRETQYRFYDCLIVAAALESGARILYSEDLQNGRRFGELMIVNPFT
jgi:predicted nucleic acid-binding protein